MRCEEFLLRYDELEPRAGLTFSLRRHLAACEGCRKQVEAVEAAFSTYRGEESARLAEGLRGELIDERVMALVRMTPRPRREFSLGQWAFPGALLAISVLILPFAAINDWLGPERVLLFPLALATGSWLVILGCFFIGSHVKELSSILDEQRASKHGLFHRF